MFFRKWRDGDRQGLQPDGSAYRRLLQPFVKHADVLCRQILTPLGIPDDPWLMLRFGAQGLQSARGMANG